MENTKHGTITIHTFALDMREGSNPESHITQSPTSIGHQTKKSPLIWQELVNLCQFSKRHVQGSVADVEVLNTHFYTVILKCSNTFPNAITNSLPT